MMQSAGMLFGLDRMLGGANTHPMGEIAEAFIKYTIFAGSLCAAVSCIASLHRKNTRRALVYGVLGLILFEFFLTHPAGFLADMKSAPYPTAVYLFIRLMRYSLGPAFFLYFKSLTQYRRRLAVPDYVHFAPQGVFWILGVLYAASSIGSWESFAFFRWLLGSITELSLAHIMAYICAAFVSYYRLERFDRTGKAAGTLIAGGILAFTAVLLLGAYAFTGLRYLELLPFGALAAFVTVWHAVLFASPGIIDGFARESKSKSYRRSLLGDVDSGMLSARLEDLMRNEKLYCDEDLSLERLAAHLSVTKNQLSELLNTVIGKNFIAYVTGFRVGEAKRLLVEEPHRSVLSVAYASGFNSKSVFYDSFKKATGMSPREFRDGKGALKAPAG